jgi:predicted GNAT family acetyltransferase
MFEDYFKELKNLDVYKTEYGFVLYRIQNDDQLYIRDIYVKPEHRKGGVAARMADEVAIMAKEQGCTLMIGDVFS